MILEQRVKEEIHDAVRRGQELEGAAALVLTSGGGTGDDSGFSVPLMDALLAGGGNLS